MFFSPCRLPAASGGIRFKYFLIVVAGLLAASAAHAAELPAGVFQMHDGAYFYPRTGFVTSHLDEMVAQIGRSCKNEFLHLRRRFFL